MLDSLKNLFGKKEQKPYKSCRFIQGGITFIHTAVRACCSHKCGVTFVENYKGQPIDWKNVNKTRKAIINNCKKGILPERCKGCIDLETKNWDSNQLIDNIFLNYWNHCNCGCVYCIQGANGEYLVTDKKPSSFYKAYEHIKYLYDNNMVSKNAHVELIGGDLAVLDESENIINRCIDYGVGRISFHSSCIHYSPAIERAFKEAPFADMDFSVDCGSREVYQRIKNIDAFDQVIENIKRYIAASDPSRNILIAKYIIVDGLNDNIEVLDQWINLMYSIGIRNMKIDVNFKRFFPECNPKDPTVPPHYYELFEHYNKRIAELGVKDHYWEFTRMVLAEGGTPKGY